MPSDLDLLAVRYVANDLPDDELAAFESRLADDQAAREAVAAAVELTLAVAQLPATSLERLPFRPRPRVCVFPLGRVGLAAACLALAVGLALQYGWRTERNPVDVPVVASSNPPEAVAIAWSGLRQSGELDLVSHSELLAWLDEPIALASADPQAPGRLARGG